MTADVKRSPPATIERVPFSLKIRSVPYLEMQKNSQCKEEEGNGREALPCTARAGDAGPSAEGAVAFRPAWNQTPASSLTGQVTLGF